MNNEYLSINQILDFTTLSDRQLRNNLIELKKLPEFCDLITGGGKGRGGKFLFHNSILANIVQRKRRSTQKRNQEVIKSRKIAEFYYSKLNFDYFGCVYPNKDIDIHKVVKFLEKYRAFYAVHRKNEMNHIHFVIQTDLKSTKIKEEIKSYFDQNKISINKVFLDVFEQDLKNETLDYLLRRKKHTTKNDLVDFGFIL